jgi:hypothetical protein
VRRFVRMTIAMGVIMGVMMRVSMVLPAGRQRLHVILLQECAASRQTFRRLNGRQKHMAWTPRTKKGTRRSPFLRIALMAHQE